MHRYTPHHGIAIVLLAGEISASRARLAHTMRNGRTPPSIQPFLIADDRLDHRDVGNILHQLCAQRSAAIHHGSGHARSYSSIATVVTLKTAHDPPVIARNERSNQYVVPGTNPVT
jgi:hypothetical protein